VLLKIAIFYVRFHISFISTTPGATQTSLTSDIAFHAIKSGLVYHGT